MEPGGGVGAVEDGKAGGVTGGREFNERVEACLCVGS